jgi:hypothetical protein
LIEATQALASTGSPSWNRRPSRKRIVQCLPPSSTRWPAIICGRGFSISSTLYSDSNTISPASRVMLSVVATGSS